MVQLLSVAYGSVGKTQFVDCLNAYQRQIKSKKDYRLADLTPYLAKLSSQDLLMAEGGRGWRCHPLLVEVATRDTLRQGTFEAMVETVHARLPLSKASWNKKLLFFSSQDQFIREVRIGLYRHDWAYIERQFDIYYSYMFSPLEITLSEIINQVCTNPFDRDWFVSLHNSNPKLYETALLNILVTSTQMLIPADEAFALLQEDCTRGEGQRSALLRAVFIEQLLWRGRLAEAEAAIAQFAEDCPSEALLFSGWLNFWRGNYDKTIEQDTQVLKQLRQTSGKRKIYFDSFSGVFLVLALLQEGSFKSLKTAEEYANIIARDPYNHWLGLIYTGLEKVAQALQGNQAAKRYLLSTPIAKLDLEDSFEVLLDATCQYWVDLAAARQRVPRAIRPCFEAAQAAGYDGLALEAAQLLARLTPKGRYVEEAERLREKTGILPLVDVIQPKEPWELALTALVGLNPGAQQKTETDTANSYRLAWFVAFSAKSGWQLQPKEQKISARGGWSRGRAIALWRLKHERSSFSYMTEQDRAICAQLVNDDRYGNKNYTFKDEAMLALVGHPLVFWDDAPTTRVDVVQGEPILLVQQIKGDWLAISLSPPMASKATVAVVKETPTQLKVVQVDANHRRIAEVIGDKNRLEVPATAKDQVLSVINAVSGMVMVHSDIGGGVANAEEVEAQPQPHVHLLPAGEGLKAALLTRPFGDHGPYYRPGTGGEMVIAEVDGKRLQTHRDLKAEKKLARAVEKSCPTLQRLEDTDREWLVGDPEDCLELLLELQDLGDQVAVEWPEGEKFRILQQASLSNFSMQIRQQRDWFAASGELKISDDQVLDMQHLMELLEASPGRFVKLEDGQFLALTQEFRKRLDELRAYSEKNGKNLRFHPLTSLAMEDWVDEVGQLKTDKHWKDHIKRLKEAQALQPELPSTLQATLRDYQLNGFQWLARLAHWGVGACLADDMGLGKTLQALAVILTRAPEGPTLIVAPTSVCMNWLSEAEKFAPTLKPIEFGSSDRQQTLDTLQPFDMVVCSYGLLQQEDVANMLAQVEWQTIVLDEAQAIKNSATKRSKAAMQLQGSFKLITTGTPIENHLGELWNLFRFINPGLLGSQDQFNQKFAVPIERYQDKQARNRLKKLIQPFILRRTKSQVLDELPARTEITLQVELSVEEMAFYEALRRDAINKLSDSDAEAGAKHLQVLAEIMRLRRSCCNTRLVRKDVSLPSAKLEAFGEILEELLGNNHKALVFSQFVDHLTILREFLDEQQVTYQYLDGSTPTKARKQRVDAFQAGEGDVFLISLKAGGTGLNLTAADFVIHMDPWWNPAVEDQASDRAHRIGQQRPVTIYRLVAKDTIEEKIVDLHRQKRDLADSLLEGADMSGKMSTNELLKLISEG